MKHERFGEQLSEVVFADLRAGNIIVITTGKDEEGSVYRFLVYEPSVFWPSGWLEAISPDGSLKTPFVHDVGLASGEETIRDETRPAFASLPLDPNFKSLTLGSRLVAKHPNLEQYWTIGGDISSLSIQQGNE